VSSAWRNSIPPLALLDEIRRAGTDKRLAVVITPPVAWRVSAGHLDLAS
jgi:hypothetical protein